MPFYGVIIKAAHSGDSTGARQLKDPVLEKGSIYWYKIDILRVGGA
jgi:hypothetical protein